MSKKKKIAFWSWKESHTTQWFPNFATNQNYLRSLLII